MTDETTLVFQYGSNTSPARLNSPKRLAGAAIPVALASTVDRFRLDFTVWSRRNRCAAADIVPDPRGKSIWGVLYRIPTDRIRRDTTPSALKSLDEIEGEGTNYTRCRVLVRPTGEVDSVEALTYVVKDRRQGLKTSLDYVRHVLDGLRQHDAPAEYVAYVVSRVVANNPTLEARLLGPP